MTYRTDLALEAFQHALSPKEKQLPGVEKTQENLSGFSFTRITIASEEGAKRLGKPQGTYGTLDLSPDQLHADGGFERGLAAIVHILQDMLPISADEPVLVAGLGNRSVTPDSLGPKVTDSLVVTRHLGQAEPELFGNLRPVAALSPGVLGITGVETGEILSGVLERIRPAALIAIDALAARRLSRLTRTIQFSDTGITPGSGVGNARFALTLQSLGIPVLAIGVPTIVDGGNLAKEIRQQAPDAHCEALTDLEQSVMVTTSQIDREMADLAKLLGFGLSLALNPTFSREDLDLFLS